MSGWRFGLGRYTDGARMFSALVMGEQAIELEALHERYRQSARAGAGALSGCRDILEVVEDWDRHFDVLQAMAEFAHDEGLDRAAGAAPQSREAGAGAEADALAHAVGGLRPLPPIRRPSKILNCASNYSAHLAEMRQYTVTGGNVDPSTIYKGDKSSAQPYLFLKAPSALVGAHDDIVLPGPEDQIDWEAELCVVIGRPARKVSVDKALEHIAGFMIFNDVSCRNLLFRADRPNLRTDWLASKSFDTFAPCGPLMIPRAFVAQHGALHIQLRVNGRIRQNGIAGEMIYSPEEQIEYVSRMMTLESGDLIATGTIGGVGQGTGEFLKAGDLVETEIEGLGMQRNRVVAAD